MAREKAMRSNEHTSRWNVPERQSNPQIDEAPQTYGNDQMLMDYLMDQGFIWEEAAKLLNMRENIYSNLEMRQRIADDSRMLFVRWLYEQGELDENQDE
jgi:hypothetical protein